MRENTTLKDLELLTITQWNILVGLGEIRKQEKEVIAKAYEYAKNPSCGSRKIYSMIAGMNWETHSNLHLQENKLKQQAV